MGEKLSKTTALLYWYILGVPICLVFFASILTLINLPVLIGFSFLLIVMYAGIVGILTIFTNAMISEVKYGLRRKKK